MNSESLGHFMFNQGKPERLVKAGSYESRSTTTLTSGEARCAKGVCEVGWKPNQQKSAQQDPAQSDELA
ncbi:MAG: hypothetical protein KGS72_04525 [Cyanobacteria bacterium REEB67]|nr:hypothetical protein [Cyanobacteria bacterium REEB67]